MFPLKAHNTATRTTAFGLLLASHLAGFPIAVVSAATEPAQVPFTVAVRRVGSQTARYSSNQQIASRIWEATSGPHASRPAGKPNWAGTVWRGQESRSFEVYPEAKILAVHEPGGRISFRRTQSARLFPSLPQAGPVRTLHTGVAGLSAEPASLQFDRVADLDGKAEYITFGRVVGLVDRYFRHPTDRTGRVDIYLLQVAEVIKAQGEPRLSFIKLQWPAEDLGRDGGTPVGELHLGEDLILCTNRSPRVQIAGTQRREAWGGEQRLAIRPPYGILRVKNGVTAPFVPSDHDAEVGFRFPEEVSLYGQPCEAFVALLKWALPLQASSAGTLPGTSGRLLGRRERRQNRIPRAGAN